MVQKDNIQTLLKNLSQPFGMGIVIVRKSDRVLGDTNNSVNNDNHNSGINNNEINSEESLISEYRNSGLNKIIQPCQHENVKMLDESLHNKLIGIVNELKKLDKTVQERRVIKKTRKRSASTNSASANSVGKDTGKDTGKGTGKDNKGKKKGKKTHTKKRRIQKKDAYKKKTLIK